MELEFLLFFEWCYVRYTNPQSGLARLVPFPEEERNQLKALVASTRFVSILLLSFTPRKGHSEVRYWTPYVSCR